MGRYEALYRRSLQQPEDFWAEAAQAIEWQDPWNRVLDTSRTPAGRWFEGASLNTAHNCLDRHVAAGRGDQAALIYDSPVTGAKAVLSYADLRDRVARFAGILKAQGVGKGDRVVIYMPMIPEAAVAMLACARLGAVHSVVFGGFAGLELAKRLDDARPKVMVTASCGIEPGRTVAYKRLYDHALAEAAHPPASSIVKQRPEHPCDLVSGRDVDFDEAMAAADPADCVPVAATDPLYILYTSGTTGKPKGIVRDNGGHAVALAWSMPNIYNIAPGEAWWAASDIGWVVGHSYIIYAPLLVGATTIMYEGKPVGTPDPGAFWRVISEHKAVSLFTAPTAFRAIRQQDAEAAHLAKYDMSAFRALFLAGERCDPDTLGWAQARLGVPVVDHWWQTETGWPITANPLGLEEMPVKPGSSTRPVPGWDVRVVDSRHREQPAGTIGDIVCKLPLPPCALPTLWQADGRFRQAYLADHPGYYTTGDAGYIDADGYVFIMARTDDVINVAGHRLSTGAIEEVLAAHPDVVECAVVGVKDALKGQLPVGLVVLCGGAEADPAEIERACVKLVREEIGPVAAFKKVAVVDRLPKTRSGKILRASIRKIAEEGAVAAPATIDDPAILDEIGAVLAGLAKR